jgi:putative membrane protein
MHPDTSWTFDPGPILLVALLAVLYIRRWAGVGASPWRLASFLAGLLAIAAALISPVDRLGEQLLTMHMVQHLLLLDVAPILLVLGLTKKLLRPVTRRLMVLEHAAGPIAGPVFAVVFYVGTMCVWHLPAMYDAALRHPAVHVLEHAFFTSAGALYWWHLLSPIRSRLRLGGMGPVVYMLSTKLGVGLLGIALTFAPTVIYGFYAHSPQFWGMSHATDQHLAGAVMALEQSIIMGIVLAWLFVQALTESEREEQRAERYGLDAERYGQAG